MKSRALGPISIHRIVEIDRLPVPATEFFCGASDEAVRQATEVLEPAFIERESRALIISFHSFVIETGGQRILVDACHGNDKRRTGSISYSDSLRTDYLANLAMAGFRPEDIDIVLCTHLHYDHVGWNTRLENGRWVPTFPNARYLMTKADFDHFSGMPEGTRESHHLAAFADSVLPVVEAGRAEFLETAHVSGFALSSDVFLESAPGHTPGAIVIRIRNGFGSAILSGDVVHHPIQVLLPQLYVEGEYDSLQALHTRERLIEDCADSGAILLPAHFPAPTAGRIVRTCDGFRFRCEALGDG